MNEEKFSGMGTVYKNYRPDYPDLFIDYLYSSLGFTSKSVIADIGSGTGILTKKFLKKGSTVYAVEPNDDMRKTAEAELIGFNNFKSVKASAENTGLLEGSIDFVTVAQAFHWFDVKLFREECKRILKPDSLVIIVYNDRDESNEIVKENAEINKKYCPDFRGFSGGRSKMLEDELFREFFESGYEKGEFDNPLKFTEKQFIGRNLSSSYALKEDDARFACYVEEIRKLFYRYCKDRVLNMPNKTVSYFGRV